MSYDGAALVRLPIADRVRPSQLVMVYKGLDQVSPELEGFIAFCRRHFARLTTG